MIDVHFRDSFTSLEQRYSLGVEDTSGRQYLSIPVTTGVVDYEEYYEIDAEEHAQFLAHPESAADFAGQCRRREHDDRLMQQPGWNRGTPS